jgi:UDP-N-acetyl-D-mannosaminuronic acid dehydrogenase
MRITVIGLGYVGLPTAALLASLGHEVRGVDSNPAVRAALSEGRVHLAEPDVAALLAGALREGRFTLHEAPPPAEVFVIAVPTPLGPDRTPVLDHVMEAARALAPALAEGSLVLLESTCPVGTTAALDALLRAARPTSRRCTWPMRPSGCCRGASRRAGGE